MSERTILHIDMNNFYASVECMLNPELRDKPVAVCGNQEERHGIVLAKNYKAKAFGVETGRAIWQAKKVCPDLVIVNPHYGAYLKMSRMARQIYNSYTDQVEPYGMDENWIDVTGSTRIYGDGVTIANDIRARIRRELGLTVSVGVSFNKIFAKLGSDMKKPDATTHISRENFKEKIWSLPADEMLGIGRSAIKILRMYGIATIGDLANAPDDLLALKFGINGARMKRFANGEDLSKVMTTEYKAPVKSIGNGTTFISDLTAPHEVYPMLLAIADTVASRLRAAHLKARRLSLTVKCNDLAWKEWQCTLPFPSSSEIELADRAHELFIKNYPWVKPVRALYLRTTGLCDENDMQQLTLSHDGAALTKSIRLDSTIDTIRYRFGHNAISRASTTGLVKLPRPQEEINLIMPSGMLTLI